MKIDIAETKPFWFQTDEDKTVGLKLIVTREKRAEFEAYTATRLKKPVERAKGKAYKIDKDLVKRAVADGLMNIFVVGSRGYCVVYGLAVEYGLPVQESDKKRGYYEYDLREGRTKDRDVFLKKVLYLDTALRDLLDRVTTEFERLDEYREANGLPKVGDKEVFVVVEEEDTHQGNSGGTVIGTS